MPESGNGSLKRIPIGDIRENQVALRKVDRSSEEYLGLVDSIRTNGVLNPIVVRELKEPGTDKTIYGLVDGLQRLTASKDAGLTDVPAHVKDLNDAQVLEAQIITNVHKIETRAAEYSKQLVRLLGANPLMTLAELSGKLSKSPSWLKERLSLIKLTDKIQELVNENRINLTNAYALAKLPEDEQAAFVDRAMTLPPSEFVPTANARVKEIKDAERQGRDPKKAEFVAVPHMRRLGEVKEEMESAVVGPQLVKAEGVTTAADGFALGIRWMLHMDKQSINEAKAKDEQKKKEVESAKLRRDLDRTTKKEKEAAEKRAEIEELARKQGVAVA